MKVEHGDVRIIPIDCLPRELTMKELNDNELIGSNGENSTNPKEKISLQTCAISLLPKEKLDARRG